MDTKMLRWTSDHIQNEEGRDWEKVAPIAEKIEEQEESALFSVEELVPDILYKWFSTI